MRTRRLGRTDLSFSLVGYLVESGGPGLPELRLSADDQVAEISRAIDCGMNWVWLRTPAGASVSAEALVARASAMNGARPYIVEHLAANATALRTRIEQILRELARDHIDLVMLDAGVRVAPEQLHDAWGVLTELRREGIVRHAGLGDAIPALIAELPAGEAIAAITPSSELYCTYSEMTVGLAACASREAGALVPLGTMTTTARDRELASIDASCLEDGSYEGFLKHQQLGELRAARRKAWADIGRSHGFTSPAAMSLAWTLAHQPVTAVRVPFLGNVQGLAELRRAAELDLTAADLEQIRGYLAR